MWGRTAAVSGVVKAMWLPSNVIPPDNRQKGLPSGLPGLLGIGIVLRGSVGSIVYNNTTGFFSVSHVFSEIRGELKAIRPMDMKILGLRDKFLIS